VHSWICAVNTATEKQVDAMLDALVHVNGEPPTKRVVTKDGVVFGSLRTGEAKDRSDILDGPAGSTIAFMGSITNSHSLRPHIKPKPTNSSDAALVLSLYRMRQRKCTHFLEGTYSFVIRHGEDFYAARDPLGAKPLYYAKSGEGWMFATEMKAFVETDLSVSEFPPGCYFESDVGARRYFKVPDSVNEKVNANEAVELVRVLVTESVNSAAKSCAEAGVYLTGTVESCIIAAILAQKNRRLRTYSVGLAGSNDGQTAKKVASWLGTDHTHIEVSEQEILDNLQNIVLTLESFDAPVVRHAVADYFAMKNAAESSQAILSGEAANELFGGYTYLRPMYHEKLSNEIKRLTEQLHCTHLQRIHRMTAAHQIEALVPFCERRLVHTVSRLPANMKVSEDGRSKWALRRAFGTVLPAWVADRPDAEDTQSMGIQQMLNSYAETVFTDDDIRNYNESRSETDPEIRSKDEMLYYQIWKTKFDSRFVPLVGRTHL
jgi:asparagine synthase (glutamine-hydrolysing)